MQSFSSVKRLGGDGVNHLLLPSHLRHLAKKLILLIHSQVHKELPMTEHGNR